MAKFMISFVEGAMSVTDEELDEVTSSAHAVVDDAKQAGVWVGGGGLRHHTEAATVSVDGEIVERRAELPGPHVAGFAVVDVESRADALEWARRFSKACHCTMEVREFLPENRYES
ncbi:YciI family protein [Aeromicrobium sp.]|uniref:YciI family protein n=1 Tax=Aeromicrobium sp. TaxID=1871063 RepID=UPI0028AE2B25|nr:YciI family protein [Aeromicrobium sp.]